MSCRVCDDLLQEHLDGTGAPGALERHLETCPECADRRAGVRRLLEGVRRMRMPVPPADLADRIASRLLSETMPRLSVRRRRLVPMAVLATAAGILLALGWWSWRAAPVKERGWPHEDKPGTGVAAQPVTPVGPLRDSMADAQHAVVALTSRKANETVEKTSTLLPLVRQPVLDPMGPMMTPIEPALEPVREAASGVSTAVAPVADSARRAVGLFLRDLPMGRATSDKKPG